jgi:hypothetical protein
MSQSQRSIQQLVFLIFYLQIKLSISTADQHRQGRRKRKTNMYLCQGAVDMLVLLGTSSRDVWVVLTNLIVSQQRL